MKMQWKSLLPGAILIITAAALNAEGRQEAPPAELGRIVHVDKDATGANNGSSWADAYNFLQDALMFAAAGDEIRVAEGVYKPDDFALSDRPNREREETFQLINNVAIKGGYAGFGQADPDARDVNEYETTLSGDREGNDVVIVDAADLLNEASREDNCYHVVTGHDTNETAVLDAFTITGGNANWGYWVAYYGGGITADSAGFTLLNCKIQGNVAAQGGGLQIGSGGVSLSGCTFSGNAAIHAGGMLNGGRTTTVADCAFLDNYADTGGGATICTDAAFTRCSFVRNRAGASTGGAVNNDCSAPTFDHCTFIENTAPYAGGAIRNFEGDLTITNCKFVGNSSDNGGGIYQGDTDTVLTACQFEGNHAVTGGAIANDGYSDPTLTDCVFTGNVAERGGGFYNTTGSAPRFANCVFSGNSATDSGGAIGSYNNYGFGPVLVNCVFAGNVANGHGGAICNDRSNPSLTNCTFAGNTAELGGGMYGENGSTATLSNCILWSDAPDELHNDNAATAVVFSDVQGGQEGKGNIDADPRFADPNSGDYHLKSQAGRYDPNSETWVIDDVTSPCIDAGDPMSPIGPEPFPNGGIINMGAHGGTAEASKSYFNKPACETIVAGDINGDCIIDFRDFCIIALHWCEDNNL